LPSHTITRYPPQLLRAVLIGLAKAQTPHLLRKAPSLRH